MGLGGVVMVESKRTETGKPTTKEARYYITSHPGTNGKFLAHVIRSHWAIENNQHWVLDMVFHEDASRIRSDNADQNMAIIRKTALNLLKQEKSYKATEQAAINQLKQSPSTLRDLAALLQHRLEITHTRSHPLDQAHSGALSLHASYTRDQILAGLGYWATSKRPAFREGVLHLPERKIDALFITLEKTEESYSPTTMYEDYAISETLFHWQSQSTTSEHSPTGQRYIHHQKNG